MIKNSQIVDYACVSPKGNSLIKKSINPAKQNLYFRWPNHVSSYPTLTT